MQPSTKRSAVVLALLLLIYIGWVFAQNVLIDRRSATGLDEHGGGGSGGLAAVSAGISEALVETIIAIALTLLVWWLVTISLRYYRRRPVTHPLGGVSNVRPPPDAQGGVEDRRSLSRTLPDTCDEAVPDSAIPPEAGPPVTGAAWKDMAAEFKSVKDLAVRAEWHKDPDRESWILAGPAPVAVDHTTVLCRRAGAMLLRSPRVAATLSARVRAHADPVDRWLQFLRERPDTRMQVRGMSHTIDIPIEGGHIRDVPTVSAGACIACAFDEV
jgi:preprotein translocase subunit SecG